MREPCVEKPTNRKVGALRISSDVPYGQKQKAPEENFFRG